MNEITLGEMLSYAPYVAGGLLGLWFLKVFGGGLWGIGKMLNKVPTKALAGLTGTAAVAGTPVAMQELSRLGDGYTWGALLSGLAALGWSAYAMTRPTETKPSSQKKGTYEFFEADQPPFKATEARELFARNMSAFEVLNQLWTTHVMADRAARTAVGKALSILSGGQVRT